MIRNKLNIIWISLVLGLLILCYQIWGGHFKFIDHLTSSVSYKGSTTKKTTISSYPSRPGWLLMLLMLLACWSYVWRPFSWSYEIMCGTCVRHRGPHEQLTKLDWWYQVKLGRNSPKIGQKWSNFFQIDKLSSSYEIMCVTCVRHPWTTQLTHKIRLMISSKLGNPL